MWHNAERMGHPMRQGYMMVIYKALYFDVAQRHNLQQQRRPYTVVIF